MTDPLKLIQTRALAELPVEYVEPWIIEHIWTRNGFNLLVGAPKSRKSTLRRYLTACALARRPAFDTFKCRDKVAKVLVIFGEGKMEAEAALQHRACAALGLAPESRPIHLAKPFGFHLDNPHHFAQLRDVIQGEGFDLVLLDPLLYFHGADENDALGMGRVCQALIALAEYAAIAAYHHTAKAQAGTPERPVSHRGRGSSTLGGAADTILELTRVNANLHRLEFSTRGAEEPEKLNLYYNGASGLFSLTDSELGQAIRTFLVENGPATTNQIVAGAHKQRNAVIEWLQVNAGTIVSCSERADRGWGTKEWSLLPNGTGAEKRPVPITPTR